MADTTKKVEEVEVDYTIANPNTLAKYKDAATIAHKVLAEVIKAATPGTTILSLCQKGDELLEEETGKVYKGKKISKGIAFPTTISPNDILTPYTPIPSEAAEAAITIHEGDVLKIQLGAQIDGMPAIVGDTIVVGGASKPEQADLLLATHYVTEALLRYLIPAAAHPSNTEEKPYKAPSAAAINQTLAKIAATYGCKLVDSTTTFTLDRNEIESKKRLVLNPGENVQKSEGASEINDVWGVEVAVTRGSGKVKEMKDKRATLFKKNDAKYQLKRQSSRQTFNEIQKKFGTFPFSLRQLQDERSAKMGVLECVRGNVLRQFEVLGDKDGEICSRIYITAAATKNGIVKLAAPEPLDVEKVKSDKKIEDQEILDLLAIPLAQDPKKKKKAKKAAAPAAAETKA
ncbi:putative curved DNA-binding protein [Ascodesmis nigricans]|uniref:Putative curved DNA-binding protein n=1 Tax=Ascodesmis nigricans TaxID=341454 RepID=A0A4S2MU42_9PEZI|nr:putative curved DNA-binding protein [Ascodesmis nigricans]